jgi:hypothetical protein
MNNLLYTPQNLQTISQLPLHHTNRGLEMMDQFKNADAATLQELMAQRQRSAEMHTADLAQKGATLESTILGNKAQGMTNEVKAATLPQEIKAKLDEFAKKADDHQWAMFESKIKNGLQSQDKIVKAQAQAMYDQLPAQIKLRQEQAYERSLREMTDNTTRRGQDISAQTTRETANIRATSTAKKFPTTPAALYAMYQNEADNPENTPEERMRYKELAERELERMVQARILAAQASSAGRPDIGALTQGGIPTRPGPQASDVYNTPGQQGRSSHQQPAAVPKTPEEAKKAGWKLMRDSKGNTAYVGPNNEIMEVK